MINILWLKQKFSKLLFLIFTLFTLPAFAAASNDLPEATGKDLDSVRKILNNDKLEEEAQNKIKLLNKKKLAEESLIKQKFDLPVESEFWTFVSELFLVKKAQLLKWDFEKPDYGLQGAIEELFRNLGFYEKKLKVLLINTPEITHFALPANKNEYIFLISVPFIRTMDLSKLEISLIILEDFLRSENEYLLSYVKRKI